MTLRLLTYLAPSVPASLFDALAGHLSEALGVDVELSFDRTRSGPRPGEDEPFTDGDADIAFVCATSYVWLTATPSPVVELVGAAWAPTDPRSAGQAVYFGDVLAPAGGAKTLHHLVDRRVAYNDDVSLSGYHSLRLALSAAGLDVDRVTFVRSGSHLRSLDLLAAGDVDAAAIDSNVWRRRRREDPHLARVLHAVAELGPHPVQPLVARAGLSVGRREAIRDALLRAHDVEVVAAELAAAELTGFVTVQDGHYAGLRTTLRELEVRTLERSHARGDG